jgi:hypothetical protein
MADEKKSGTNWGAIILGGCGCLLFGIGTLAVIGYFAYTGVMAATEAPETAVQQFLAAAGDGDAETAHSYFSAALKEVQPLEDFQMVLEQNPGLFVVVDTTFNERSRDMTKASFSGTVTLANGSELPASFVLVEEDGAWKLISYNIGSGE